MRKTVSGLGNTDFFEICKSTLTTNIK